MIPKSPRRTKPYATLTSRKSMNKRGKSTRSTERQKWHKELLADWQSKGINSCEFNYDGCMQTFGQALAHSKKRRFITTKEDYEEVGLACIKCHEKLDLVLSHEEMEAEVKRIIESRGNA